MPVCVLYANNKAREREKNTRREMENKEKQEKKQTKRTTNNEQEKGKDNGNEQMRKEKMYCLSYFVQKGLFPVHLSNPPSSGMEPLYFFLTAVTVFVPGM